MTEQWIMNSEAEGQSRQSEPTAAPQNEPETAVEADPVNADLEQDAAIVEGGATVTAAADAPHAVRRGRPPRSGKARKGKAKAGAARASSAKPKEKTDGRTGPRGDTAKKLARAEELLKHDPKLSAETINQTIVREFKTMLAPRWISKVKKELGIKVTRGRKAAAKRGAPRPRGRPKGSSRKVVRTASQMPSHIIAVLKGRKLATITCTSRKDAETHVLRQLKNGVDEKNIKYFSASELSIKQVIEIKI